jgi:DNA-damage-inducible protein D
MEQDNKIVLFQEKQIRRIWHNEQWYFSVVDVIEALTDSTQPNRYWADIKKRSKKENEQPFAFCEQLKMPAADGRNRLTEVANTEGVFRIIMAIPSPKAEPFRLWLAQVGRGYLEEIDNPEIGFERLREIYKAKGYSEEWIERRMQSIETRKQLTDEWKKRDVKEGQEYAILTATIAKGTFGLTPTEHKEYKGLEKPTQNLRDHMTPLELIFTALSEETTRMIAEKDDAKGFNENFDAALEGGNMAGKYRKQLEERTGSKVVSKENYLNQIDTDSETPLLDTPTD